VFVTRGPQDDPEAVLRVLRHPTRLMLLVMVLSAVYWRSMTQAAQAEVSPPHTHTCGIVSLVAVCIGMDATFARLAHPRGARCVHVIA
jgi:hypothetical protein